MAPAQSKMMSEKARRAEQEKNTADQKADASMRAEIIRASISQAIERHDGYMARVTARNKVIDKTMADTEAAVTDLGWKMFLDLATSPSAVQNDIARARILTASACNLTCSWH